MTNSDRRKADEEALQLTHFSLNHAPDAVYWMDPDGKFLYVNDTACRMLGYSREELLSMGVADIDPNMPGGVPPEMSQATKKAGVGWVETEHRAKDGRIIPVEVMVTYFEYQGKEYHCSFVRDITEFKRALEVLEESEDRYRDMYDNAPDMFVSVEAETAKIRNCNQTLVNNLGYSKAEIIGRPIFDRYHPDCMEDVKKAFDSFATTGEVHDAELQLKRKDGSKIDVLLNVSAVRDENGKVLYSRSNWRDITERKKAEEALAASEEKFRGITERSFDAILMTDVEGRYTYISPADERNTGIKAEDALGKSFLEFLPESTVPEARELFARVKNGESFEGVELQAQTKDGTPFFVESNVTPVYKDKEVTGFQIIYRNITERRQIERMIRALVESTGEKTGQEFFGGIVSNLCEWLHADCAIIGEVVDDAHVRALAMQLDGKPVSGYEYDLPGTPCNNVAAKGYCTYPEGVCELFPDDKDLVEMQAEGYVGTPLRNKQGNTIGILCAISRDPLSLSPKTKEVFDILAGRAAAEITRLHAEESLQHQLEESEKSRQSMLYMLEDMNESRTLIEQGKREWEQTFDAVTGPIFLHDGEFRIVRANRAYAEHAGMEIEEVIGRLYWEVFPRGDGPLPGCLKALEKAEEEEEEEVVIEDGRTFHFHSFAIKDKKGMRTHSIHFMQDVTERKQAEMNLEHANRALAALSSVNHALVHAENEEDLLQAICRTIAGHEMYAAAWVGYAQKDKNSSIKIMASVGVDHALLDKVRPSWAENKLGMGPSGRAIRSGGMQVTQDVAADPEYQPWGDMLLKNGCVSGITLPLADADQATFGLLHVYAKQVNAFTDSEIKLLEEVAEDLAFGIRSLRTSLHRDEILEVNQQQLVQIHQNLQETIAAVARAVEARDPYTAGHQLRVAELATAIARAMKMEESQIEGIQMGATIHDIGKIHLPAEILSKPSKLTEIEYALIQAHSQVGYDILKDIEFPWPVADIAHQHHERLDGSGYPLGLKGDQICMEARIVGVADVVEAMSSHRPYRPALGIDAALAEIREHRGGWYDEHVVDACLELFAMNKFSFE